MFLHYLTSKLLFYILLCLISCWTFIQMQIVTQKDHLTAPPEHPDGYAVLGFFINVCMPQTSRCYF